MELSCHQKGGGGGGRVVLIWAKRGARGVRAGLGRRKAGVEVVEMKKRGGGGLLVHLRWGCVLGKGMKTGFETQNNIL